MLEGVRADAEPAVEGAGRLDVAWDPLDEGGGALEGRLAVLLGRLPAEGGGPERLGALLGRPADEGALLGRLAVLVGRLPPLLGRLAVLVGRLPPLLGRLPADDGREPVSRARTPCRSANDVCEETSSETSLIAAPGAGFANAGVAAARTSNESNGRRERIGSSNLDAPWTPRHRRSFDDAVQIHKRPAALWLPAPFYGVKPTRRRANRQFPLPCVKSRHVWGRCAYTSQV